jgi:hypothetical protein
MNLVVSWFLRLRFGKTLAPMAREIANRCQSEVCQRAWTLGHRLPRAEARGYVRVRARRPIQREVDATLYRQPPWRRQQRERLVELALQRVVANTVAELNRASSEPPRRHAA